MSIITVPDDYATIALGYKAAAHGDTVYIKESGSPYTEPYINVLKGVKFEGESTEVIFNSNSLFNFYINYNDVEIDTLHLKVNEARQNVYIGSGKTDVYIHHNKLERVTGITYEYIYARGKDTRIEYNNFYGTINHGLRFYHPTGLQKAIGNNFHGNILEKGIWVQNDQANTSYNLEDNIIEDIGSDTLSAEGIDYTGSPAAAASIIKGNTITGALKGVSSGALYGLRATQGNVEITENVITGAYRQNAVYLHSGCHNAEVHFNDITGGVVSNAKDDGVNNVWDKNSKGNYWGYGGEAYDSDGDAIGDNPYNIAGSANNKDNYPLMCSIGIWPECPYLAVRKKWALGRVGVRFIRL